ncbi:MAG TPA: adenylate/guanylate cyclase domain-containing protein [Desulfuromonadaceae bacterium]|nr:adenylate/guanylate cyclase domain-containing protein [Desulfuromonadaceae bacterium]
MSKFLSQYSRWIIIGFGMLVFALTQMDWLVSQPYWQKAEGALVDQRYVRRGQMSRVPAVVLVGLGSTALQLDTLSSNEIAASPTLQLMREPFPWDRRIYAAVLEKLMDAGAKVVVFDFVFASEMDGDDEFAQALQKYKERVVIGEMFQDEQGTTGHTKHLVPPNSRLLLPGTESSIGFVNIRVDGDGVVRQQRYRTSVNRETLETDVAPGVAAVLRKEMQDGKAPDDLEQSMLRAAEKFQGPTSCPAPDQAAYIDFQGPAGTYRALPVENMFVDALWGKPPFENGFVFKNKIVIVGPMAEIFHDVHTTPFGEMPGPEVQAQILAALLKGTWLRPTSDAFDFMLALVMLLFGLSICLFIRNALIKVGLLVVVVVLFFVACQIIFTGSKLVLPMMQPLVCLIVPSAFGVTFLYAVEQIERKRYRNVLSRYVSANVAKVVLEDTRSLEEMMSGGKKKPVTILFSDIRGFTTITETTDADKLVAQLNEYFGEMVDIIQEANRGTLQKFIGDAIMAAWGDILSDGLAEDARRAVTAALQMRPALAKLNGVWKENPDRLKLAIGIGVNHGEVIHGNVGSHDRMELTVLGDGVNLAARLESATKQFHTDILIGEDVEKLTRDHFVYRNVGAIAFKGKTKPVETFYLLSDRSVPAPKWLASYHEAIQLYRKGEFEKAAELFRKVGAEIGQEDFLCEMYLEKCAVDAKRSLPSNWDGSITLSEK